MNVVMHLQSSRRLAKKVEKNRQLLKKKGWVPNKRAAWKILRRVGVGGGWGVGNAGMFFTKQGYVNMYFYSFS